MFKGMSFSEDVGFHAVWDFARFEIGIDVEDPPDTDDFVRAKETLIPFRRSTGSCRRGLFRTQNLQCPKDGPLEIFNPGMPVCCSILVI